ncbi:alpha-N-acetylgalactosaminide alpha-2,6-sialyltransferase 2-like isoform X2 [Triplophysa rosa]|uniref:alpha-N-acetylgalactosaminide alpha-2,6-sialyltransferase 2-like isoform X2 n=1 Tax=Triplophysa rosa TaxID=992332 RepID=UPI002545C585|nr:alpha-N-acetylgalactosaminide alpha-2,6-sialyltransferase 2-like isoform X2 [Triplophysa rosa]
MQNVRGKQKRTLHLKAFPFKVIFKLKTLKTMRSCSSANSLCAFLAWIYRLLCFRNFKLWFCRLPLLCVCVFLVYWNFLRLTSPEDLDTIYQRAALEAEQSWVETLTAEEETVSACSLRHTVKKDDSLRKRFNFFVPLLQWRDSFSPTVWQKLQNASLPYGWKGEAHKVIGKTLSLLWHSSTSRLFERNTSHECVRCAVVGNGGILRGSGQGKVIDSHDYVFRVNAAIIKGFEDDVGTKTSFYGFTTNSLKNSFLAYHRDGFKTIPHDPGIRYIVIPAQTRDYVMLAAAIQGVSVPSGIDEGDRASLESEESWTETDSIGENTVPACSLRNTVNKDNNMTEHFKFTVPVFQWRGSFIQSTLEKLQNSTLPYGWKQLDHDVIGKTLSLLWHSSASRLFERNTSHECVRCAVVGNGGILRGSGQGKVIDSHDYVFSPSEYFGDNAEFRMLHPYFIQYVTKRFLNSPQMETYGDVYMPSTGALMLLTALHTCDQVSAFGFMTDNYNDFSDHYYDKVHREVVHYANHDLMMESSLWKLLHTHKVMRLYQRQIKKGRRRVR